jgi:hypothetical protein
MEGSWCSKECKRLYYLPYERLAKEKRRLARVALLVDVECEQCGDLFTPTRLGARFCGTKCSRRSRLPRVRVKSMKLHHHQCGWCQGKFIHRRSGVKHCSEKCSSEAYNFRRSTWEAAKLNYCEWCGFGFVGKGVFCGEHCERAALNLLGRLVRVLSWGSWYSKQPVLKRCKKCSKLFRGRGILYCSKRCFRAWARKKLKESDPERWRQYRTASKQRRRARIRGSRSRCGSTHGLRGFLKRVKASCFYCGKDYGNNFHVDHFVPVSKGGPEAEWNLRQSCHTCNESKSDQFPWEFYINHPKRQKVSPWGGIATQRDRIYGNQEEESS